MSRSVDNYDIKKYEACQQLTTITACNYYIFFIWTDIIIVIWFIISGNVKLCVTFLTFFFCIFDPTKWSKVDVILLSYNTLGAP